MLGARRQACAAKSRSLAICTTAGPIAAGDPEVGAAEAAVGLGIILAFVGVKMIISRWYHIPTAASLLVIVASVDR